MIVENVSCKFNKMPEGHLTSINNVGICDVGTETASTVTAGYHKGIGEHKNNMVLDKTLIIDDTQGFEEKPRIYNDVAPTLRSQGSGLKTLSEHSANKKVCAIDEQNLNFRYETFGTLTTDGSSPKHNNRVMEYTNTQYRIRKLTPKECWRLMAFTDEDFHNAEAVNSNTQLYKQAGNSIVVSVLEAIFRQMNIQNIPSWNEEKGA
jgi:DNA (cytosine-5)-methyltransferase 1